MQLNLWVGMAFICAVVAQICAAADSPSLKNDKIKSLPGQPQVSFQQYAGYVTVDENQQRALFYYFVEAESEPASKPLVLWLNGGPGCSSVGGGAFSEHGPFRPIGGGILSRNNYSWNKEANMLYLESPAGVGFSYSKNTTFYKIVDDSITAQDNLMFLQSWFAKFPAYKNRELFVAGESYAGHYVPQLAQLIVQSGLKINLKGMSIGNPLLEFGTDLNSQGDFYWSHGLISDDTFELLTTICNTSQLQRERITGNTSAACERVRNLLRAEIPRAIDNYDVTADVCVSSTGSKLEPDNRPFVPKDRSLSFLQSPHLAIYGPKSAGNADPCMGEKGTEYLNRKDVQEALHAELVQVANWTACSRLLDYDRGNLLIPTIDVVATLVKSGIRVLVYSGDQDSAIPFIGTRILVRGMAKELGLSTTLSYSPWFEDKQVGGWTEAYAGGIVTYATIRGAAHMAPLSSPGRSLALFTAFLKGKPLVGA